MGVTIFPTVNDVGGGKLLDEANITAMVRAVTDGADRVLEGLEVVPHSGMQAKVTPGTAVISGYVVRLSEAVILEAVPVMGPREVYLELQRDGLGHVTGARAVAGPIPPPIGPDKIRLALVQAESAPITAGDITDERPVGWRAGVGTIDPTHRIPVTTGSLYDVLSTMAAHVLALGGDRSWGYPVDPASYPWVGHILDSSEDPFWTPPTKYLLYDGPAHKADHAVVKSPDWQDYWTVRLPYSGCYTLRVRYAQWEAADLSQIQIRYKLPDMATYAETAILDLPSAIWRNCYVDLPWATAGDTLLLGARNAYQKSVRIWAPYLYGERIFRPYTVEWPLTKLEGGGS